jgi:lipopolysaccharide export system ATP-binding protein
VLKITDRSYLIKDGKVRTHGSPQEIVRDPIAINEYLGQGFSDDSLFTQAPSAPSSTMIQPLPPPPAFVEAAEPAVYQVLEQEKIHRLIERLKTDNHAAATTELLQRGALAVPALIEALDRRDVDLRAQVHMILQQVLGRAVPFDPYAPESERRQQVALLRDQLERRAG